MVYAAAQLARKHDAVHSVGILDFRLPDHIRIGLQGKEQEKCLEHDYFAMATERVSRITVILTWPG